MESVYPRTMDTPFKEPGTSFSLYLIIDAQKSLGFMIVWIKLLGLSSKRLKLLDPVYDDKLEECDVLNVADDWMDDDSIVL